MNDEDLSLYRKIHKELSRQKKPIDLIHLSMNLNNDVSDILNVLKNMSKNNELTNNDDFEKIELR